jgi:D-glycero-D-manno-heptose 1,7-bisphosphate phosphatase
LNKQPAVFLDRDGTLIEEKHYLKELNDIILFKDTASSIGKLNQKSILAIMVSNQSGVARGYYSNNQVQALNKHMDELLISKNAHIDGFYYCSHHIDGIIPEYTLDCNCRKPKTGMIEQAIIDFPQIDLARSYVVGDKICDIQLGQNFNIKTVLVKTGHGLHDFDEFANNSGLSKPDFFAENLSTAINWILSDLANK